LPKAKLPALNLPAVKLPDTKLPAVQLPKLPSLQPPAPTQQQQQLLDFLLGK
jgi:hypothetical protein